MMLSSAPTSARMAARRPSLAAHARAPRGKTSGGSAGGAKPAAGASSGRRKTNSSAAGAAALDADSPAPVPPHVAEARAWIAAWRARVGNAPAAAAPSSSSGKVRARSASGGAGGAGGGGGGGATAPCSVGADGTLTFTAAKLAKVSYSDVKL